MATSGALCLRKSSTSRKTSRAPSAKTGDWPQLSRKSRGTPMTRMRSASPRAGPRARGKNSGWPGGRTPRAMPLTFSGRCAAPTRRFKSSSAVAHPTPPPPNPAGRFASRMSPAADQEHRTVTCLRLRQRRDRVGDAWAGRDRGDPALARDLGPPLGGKSRRLLVADVDDSDAVLCGACEDRPDVAAVEREQVADPRALQGERDQLAGIDRVCHWAMANGIAGVLKTACGGPS